MNRYSLWRYKANITVFEIGKKRGKLIEFRADCTECGCNNWSDFDVFMAIDKKKCVNTPNLSLEFKDHLLNCASTNALSLIKLEANWIKKNNDSFWTILKCHKCYLWIVFRRIYGSALNASKLIFLAAFSLDIFINDCFEMWIIINVNVFNAPKFQIWLCVCVERKRTSARRRGHFGIVYKCVAIQHDLSQINDFILNASLCICLFWHCLQGINVLKIKRFIASRKLLLQHTVNI